MYKPLVPLIGVFNFSRIFSAFYHIYQIEKAIRERDNRHILTIIKSIWLFMQSSQGGDLSPEPWLGDSRKIGLGMQEKILWFS